MAYVVVLALTIAACGGEGDPVAPSSSVSTTTTTTVPAVTMTESTTTTIRRGPLALVGDRGPIVATLQHLLTCNGYGNLTADGFFGPQTMTAVEAAQADIRGGVNGIVNEALFADLATMCDTPMRVLFPSGASTVTISGYAAAGTRDRFRVKATGGQILNIGTDAPVDLRVVGIDGDDVLGNSAGDYLLDVTGTYTILTTPTGVAGPYDITIMVETLPSNYLAIDGPAIDLGAGCLLSQGGSAFEVSFVDLGVVIGVGGATTRVDHETYTLPEVNVSGGLGSDHVDAFGTIGVIGPGRGDERFPLAFGFTTAGIPRCKGFSLIGDIILQAEGIGLVSFGWTDDDALVAGVVAALGLEAPDADTGWVKVDPRRNSQGACRSTTTELRVVQVWSLLLAFWDARTDAVPAGGRHFTAYVQREDLSGPIADLTTLLGLAVGDEIARIEALYPDATERDGVVVLEDTRGYAVLEAIPSIGSKAIIGEIAGGIFCTEPTAG